jgi:lysine 2,3-aminomutase
MSDLAGLTGFAERLTAPMRALAGRPGIDRQFLADHRELQVGATALADPIGDDLHAPVQGLTHRYPDRVILRVTLSCLVHCRFCFRREVVGEAGPLDEAALGAAMAYIAARPAIREVILTGGDPLSLSERRLTAILDRLEAIPHLDTLRIHSRIPAVEPGRITDSLARRLGQGALPVWFVLHVNHADELTDAAAAAIARLTTHGVPVLSQSVLLRGVNDDAATLETLFRRLLRLRVKPYYLHHCDLARGAEHFRTTIAQGQTLMQALRGRLPGTALPTYVLDIPGGRGKVPIGPDYLTALADGWQVRDPNGALHPYQDPEISLPA